MDSNITSFFNSGFLIIENAFDQGVVDAAKNSLMDPSALDGLIGLKKRRLKAATPNDLDDPKFRFRDLYVKNPLVAQLIFSNTILQTLSQLSNGPILAFQNLGFTHGSELQLHRDTSYIALSSPSLFLGVWIALEDIQEGSGELIYYPGSHKLPPYHFTETSTHHSVARDGILANEKYHRWLRLQMQEANLTPRKFLARKGDCLIWHGDLAHAGAPILDQRLSRYSLATHFCPQGVLPRYYANPRRRTSVRVSKLCSYSSAHYDLSAAAEIIN